MCAILVASLFAGCAEPQPEFVSRNDKFGVKFRGAPKLSEKLIGGNRSAVYSLEAPDGAETVAVTDLPLKGDEPPEAVPWLLKSAKDDLLRESGGKLTSEAGITLAGKYQGREFTARVAEPHAGVLRARIFLVGKRLYQVVVMGTDDYANSPAATAFLESFRLAE